ncbi:MAG: MBL fold metallo-hydrolase [Saprospiraceae bacterium]|nr:MBL fold metallo-hydrolase [Saprospiraceae bacterium]
MKPLLYILLISTILSCRSEKVKGTFQSQHFNLVELTDGVYACIHKPGGKAICNVGIIDNGNETIIFDSFLSPEAAEEIPKIVSHYNLSPIRYVINSHYHNDHIRGNQIFDEDVKIISTTRTAELIAEKEPLEIADEKEYGPERYTYYDSLDQEYSGNKDAVEYQKIMMWKSYYEILSTSHKEITTRIPEMLITEEHFLNGPDRKVRLLPRGKGHTDSDLVLFLPEDGILFTGDLVFNQCHPYLAHGSLHEWKEWLNYLLGLKPASVIPGHGNIGDTATIMNMKTYIEAIENIAHQINFKEEISTDLIPGAFKDWWFDRFFPVNLGFAFENKTPDLEKLWQNFQSVIVNESDVMKLALTDEWYPLISNPNFRPGVRETLKANNRASAATMTRSDEPGQQISVDCVILDESSSQPLRNVSVELVHTDIHGLYFPESGMWNPRIFAFLNTDQSGTVSVNTIMPGRYYGDEESLIPAHIHFTLEKKGYRMYASEFMFDDDPIYQATGNPENLPVARKIEEHRYLVTIQMQKQ